MQRHERDAVKAIKETAEDYGCEATLLLSRGRHPVKIKVTKGKNTKTFPVASSPRSGGDNLADNARRQVRRTISTWSFWAGNLII